MKLFNSQNSGRYREDAHMDKPDPNNPKYQGRDGAELLDSDMRRWKLDQQKDESGAITTEANKQYSTVKEGSETFVNEKGRYERRRVITGDVEAPDAKTAAAEKKKADEAAAMKAPGQTGVPSRDQYAEGPGGEGAYRAALRAYQAKEDEKKARAKANANTMRQ